MGSCPTLQDTALIYLCLVYSPSSAQTLEYYFSVAITISGLSSYNVNLPQHREVGDRVPLLREV